MAVVKGKVPYVDLEDAVSKKHSHENIQALSIVENTGEGTAFLANDGTYKQIQIPQTADDLAFMPTESLPVTTTGEAIRKISEMQSSLFSLAELLSKVAGYNPSTTQKLTHNESGELMWVTE